MGMNFTNLNVNPCKMCMPMGAVTAMYGIRKCMSILHGSQGCSTYIRRHMATHYNEPVDIASSSLTEQGTVFGGERNLLQGLENLIRLYDPEIIGVSTTCLAETIGEDVPAIIRKFYELHPESKKIKIISLSTPGYGGTQYEGFFRALYAVLTQVEMKTLAHEKINIITGPISPADTRYLKNLLEKLGLSYILLPDLSENLDGVHGSSYQRLPQGGTAIAKIAEMAGARYTIELASFVDPEISPAKYLYDTYQVPYCRLDLPCGLVATDALLAKLKELGGKMTQEMEKERGRYLDALIDSHKYNALGRAAIFGEPDFVKAVVNLCCESGVVPTAVTTGSVCKGFAEALAPAIEKAAAVQFTKTSAIEDDADFETLERKIIESEVNIMIGNSDGRRIAERQKLPLVRCSFPIHDQIGGQRVRMLGYDGSLMLLDRIANSLLLQRDGNFRQETYQKYFKSEDGENMMNMDSKSIATEAEMKKKTAEHPCYTCGQGNYARMHLPIAPKCNIQCNYCLRKYDCPNESRPGVTTEILNPEQALKKYLQVKEKMPNLKVVGIAGPGDALANFSATKETLQLIRKEDPDVTFCLSTNGLMLPLYAAELIELGVTHVTITINAVDPKIGAAIYHHVDYMGMQYTGESAAAILLANQLAGLQYLTTHGMICKVNIVVLKGINDAHVETVVKKVKELGCYITNIMQMIPVKGSAFETMPLVSHKEIAELRETCGQHMLQMKHCHQCRADAIGTLDHDVSIEYRNVVEDKAVKEAAQRFAVATKSGMLVDQHFGHATEFYIYESDGMEARFLEKRSVEKYCSGSQFCDEGADRIERLLHTIEDCNGVLALRVGDSPQQRLDDMGIRVISTYDRIEDAVKKAAKEA